MALTERQKKTIAHRLAREALQDYEYLNVVEEFDHEELTDAELEEIHDHIVSATVIV